VTPTTFLQIERQYWCTIFAYPPQHQQQEVIPILSLDIFALPSHGRIENNRRSN
jgi:hypothetical protein